MGGLSAQVTEGFSTLSTVAPVPVLPALHAVVPGGGLRPGTVTSVEESATLALALTAGLGDEWAAVVGLPEANIDAVAAMTPRTDDPTAGPVRGLTGDLTGDPARGLVGGGAGGPARGLVGGSTSGLIRHRTDGGAGDPLRMLLVDDPGRRWADVVAALTEACALVLARPPERPAPQAVRRLGALARRNGCALVMAGSWQGADLRLRVERGHWAGVGAGHGHLRGRRALVSASGRGAAGAGLSAWLWLPGPDGSVTVAATPEDLAAAPRPALTAAG